MKKPTKTIGFVLGASVALMFASACTPPPQKKVFEPPAKTNWAPIGARTVGQYDYDVIPQPDAWHTMHAGTNNSDNLWIATAPMLALDWVAETAMYTPEGPTYDNEGNLYFSPLYPTEDVSLISLNRETGQRNWAITGNGDNSGSGAVLILNDPLNAGKQIIYHATYTEVMAINPDSSIVWQKSTGLSLPAVVQGERSTTHSYGFNYHPQSDSLVSVTGGGEILAFDRETGNPTAPVFQLPGAPALSEYPSLPQFIIDSANALTDQVFGQTPSGLSFYSLIIDVIFGGGSQVTNFFAIDPNTGRIYVAATMYDAADGTVDGLSELGAIYRLELVDDGSGGLEFAVVNTASFVGGTGSTPTLSEDGSRIYASDNLGNVIVLDSALNELWRLDVGEPLAASVSVSPDNNELYVVTRENIFKLIDNGSSGSLVWTANLNAFDGYVNVDIQFNALTPSITANGIAVSVGGGKELNGNQIMLHVGVGLLDRETGQLRYFTEGREESIAVISVGPDGGIYNANSPVRRVPGKIVYPGLTKSIIGGISRYKPIRLDLLARDAICAAEKRAANAVTITGSAPLAAAEDIRQIQVLINQSRAALPKAVSADDMSVAESDEIEAWLDSSEANLDINDMSTLPQATSDLAAACALF